VLIKLVTAQNNIYMKSENIYTGIVVAFVLLMGVGGGAIMHERNRVNATCSVSVEHQRVYNCEQAKTLTDILLFR